MAAVFACLHEDRVRKLILLAPACIWNPFDSVWIGGCKSLSSYITGCATGWFRSQRAHDCGLAFENHTFNAVDDDHSLHNTFATLNWHVLLDVQVE